MRGSSGSESQKKIPRSRYHSSQFVVVVANYARIATARIFPRARRSDERGGRLWYRTNTRVKTTGYSERTVLRAGEVTGYRVNEKQSPPSPKFLQNRGVLVVGVDAMDVEHDRGRPLATNTKATRLLFCGVGIAGGRCGLSKKDVSSKTVRSTAREYQEVCGRSLRFFFSSFPAADQRQDASRLAVPQR